MKKILLLFGVVVFIVGIIISVVFIFRLIKPLQSLGWASTKGSISKSLVIRKGAGTSAFDRSFIGDVEYNFSVNSVNYTGDTVDYAGKENRDKNDANKFVAKYRPGAQVEVFYQASNPKENCLEPGPTLSMILSLLLGLALFVFGIIFMIAGMKISSKKSITSGSEPGKESFSKGG